MAKTNTKYDQAVNMAAKREIFDQNCVETNEAFDKGFEALNDAVEMHDDHAIPFGRFGLSLNDCQYAKALLLIKKQGKVLKTKGRSGNDTMTIQNLLLSLLDQEYKNQK